jgi:Carboxypeptidase regulatory-like domain
MNTPTHSPFSRILGIFCGFCVCLLVFSGHAAAQGYGSIVGSVLDPTGAAIGNATVTATQTDTGRKTVVTSAGDGSFVFPTLQPANYSVSVSAQGFQSYDQSGILLEADQSVTVKAKLAIGSATETVEVTSAVPQVDTTSGTLSQVIDTASVADLPLNGRNAAALITLVAGVVVAPGNGLDQGATKTFPVAVSVTANGAQANQSNYLLNGGNNLDELTNVNGPYPFPDAIQEFSVQTSNYNAQFGQAAGAVVNIVTKAGTRKFHGAVFEFLRNGYFNAKPYFATSADTIHRHQFGGTIGGPVIIPHLSTGERTQFFFGYQHTLFHQLSSSSQATVPTLAEEGLTPGGPTYADYGSLCTGTFTAVGTGTNPGSNYCSNSAQQLYNPYTGKEYALDQIPASDFDPAAVQLESHVPTYTGTVAPGKVGGVVFYNKPTIQAYNEYFARVDHDFSANDHLFGHYYNNDFAQAGILDPNELLSYASFSNVHYQSALLSETHAFTTSLLNSLVVSYQREISLRGGPPGSPDVTDYGVTNLYQPPENKTIQSVGISGFFTISSSAYALWERNNYTFNDDVHWVKGNHNFGFGGHIELSKFDLTNTGSSNGTFAFASVSLGSPTTHPELNYVNALANYQIGYMSGFQQGIAEFINDRNHFPGLYVQDSWKATSRLTLNYGLRWEEFSPWTDRLGGTTVFNPTNYAASVHSSVYSSLPAGMLVSGDSGIAPQGVYNQYKQFMPRVGFALDIYGDGKTVLRGGGGIFYQDRLPGFTNLNQVAGSPYTVSVKLTDPGKSAGAPGGPFSNPYCTGCAAGAVANPFPYSLPFPSTKTFPTPQLLLEYDSAGHFQVPVTDDFNLTLEQQLAPDIAMRLAYVGSVSRHEWVDLEINPAVNNGSGLSTDLRRPYNTAPTVGPCTTATGCAASYTQIVEASMSGSGGYNSLQATLEKRMSHGISMMFNYTWSKALDDQPYALGVSNTEDLNAGESYVYPLYPSGVNGGTPANYKALDYGPSDFDHPNVFSASYVYQVPKLGEGNGFLKAVVNGWRISGLIQHHSGDALTVVAGSDRSLTGLGQDRGQKSATVAAYTSQTGTGNCSSAHCKNWFSTGAFALPVNSGALSGTGFGNVQKGSIRGPAYTNWDAGVIRAFPIYRESDLEFRVEYFDVLNHTILNDPATSLASSTFGEVTGENGAGPRIAQFSLKYRF